ncbi:mitochondrial matrix iron-sulfur protein [Microbotryomycetes sp. JL201]|nr:mitochondrial matrix iron-sulfur protein [Microbotryomycetes sp. JL201]
MAMLRHALTRVARHSTSKLAQASLPLASVGPQHARSPLSAERQPQASTATYARSLSTSTARLHGGKGKPAEGKGITLHFKRSNGEIETVQANEGDDIVDVSWEYDLDIEAACEKSVACSTCHVILEDDVFDKLEEPSDDENDMLDLAFGLTDTSRLGCQIKVQKWMDGTTITLPSATRNLRVDGSKPSHH